MEFSGTNERICLVKGKIASVLKVSDVILEKIREKVDNNTPSDIFDHKGMERKNEVSKNSNYRNAFALLSIILRHILTGNRPDYHLSGISFVFENLN